MKNLSLLSILLLCAFLGTAQNAEKETVYLLFNISEKEKCKVDVEGKGYQLLNKYRKEVGKNQSFFHICDESFAYNARKNKNASYINDLKGLNIVDTAYIVEKKSKSIMKYNPFEKIYIIEIIKKDKMMVHEVLWIDDWTMIRD